MAAQPLSAPPQKRGTSVSSLRNVEQVRSAPSRDCLQTRVHFRVCKEAEHGESLRVVGSHPSLGDWKPEKGWRLTTNESIYPCWISAEPIVVNSFTKIEYKYVVCGEKDDRPPEWESHEGNRSFVPMGTDMTVEDDEGVYRQAAATVQDDNDDENAAIAEPAITIKTPAMRRTLFEHKLKMLRDLEGQAEVGAQDTVFMVALSLPIRIVRGDNGVWCLEEKAPTDGRNFAWLPLIKAYRQRTRKRVVCIGWPGIHVEDPKEQAQIERLLRQKDYIPVFPPRQALETFMNFCTTFLWPVFHDVMMFFHSSKPIAFDEQGWAAYTHINNLWANAVVPHTHETDLIWVHDYHLLMTPAFIARKLVKANIGFYLHTPFPSSDSFKSLPIREELLSGMLCTDQLGFQFFAYARNFLISVKRICGHDPSFKAGGFFGLECNGRHIMIRVAHFVYPFADTKSVVRDPLVLQQAQDVRTLFGDKTIFASMDRCDNLSGLVPKFRAFRKFLKANEQYRGKVVLVQYTYTGSSFGASTVSPLLDMLVEQSDGFLEGTDDGGLRIVPGEGKSVDDCHILLRIEKVNREDRLALFRAANVLLDTSVKAGLNLMPFEFVTAHYDELPEAAQAQEGAKPCQCLSIISEFSGCSRVLLGSSRVNPWNTQDLVAAMKRAIEMPQHEREELHETNLRYVSGSSPDEWFRDFLEDLRRNRKKEGMQFQAVGFGARIRHIATNVNFQKLPTQTVLAAYRNAKNRVLLFDNEGTLAADNRHILREYGAPKGVVSDLKSQGTAPNERVLEYLRTLTADQRNTVVILSGRDRGMLEDWFRSVPRLGLAAERGFYYRFPGSSTWHCMKPNPDYTWQSYAFEIMRQFMRRTQGSFIESKGSALVWQYRDADQHFGSWQAKELSTNLKELLFGFDVEVLNGKGYVEVKLKGVNKGIASSKIISKVEMNYGEVDFVLCIGDDRSDEAMFEAVAAHFDGGVEEDGASQDEGQDIEDTLAAEGPPVAPLMPVTPIRTPRSSESSDKLGSLGLAKQHKRGLSGTMPAGLPGGLGTFSSLGSGRFTDLARMGSGSLNYGTTGSGSYEDLPAPQLRVFTCTVGNKPSAAKFFLDDVEEVSELLGSLKAQQDRRLQSAANSYTWSQGDLKRGQRVGSMPALSSIDYGARQKS